MNDSNINHNWNSWRLWMWTKQQHPHPQPIPFLVVRNILIFCDRQSGKRKIGANALHTLRNDIVLAPLVWLNCTIAVLFIDIVSHLSSATQSLYWFTLELGTQPSQLINSCASRRNIKSEISNGTTKRCNWKASWDSGNVHHNSRSNWNAHANPRSIEAYGFLFAGELNTFHLEFHFCVWLEESASICMCE